MGRTFRTLAQDEHDSEKHASGRGETRQRAAQVDSTERRFEQRRHGDELDDGDRGDDEGGTERSGDAPCDDADSPHQEESDGRSPCGSDRRRGRGSGRVKRSGQGENRERPCHCRGRGGDAGSTPGTPGGWGNDEDGRDEKHRRGERRDRGHAGQGGESCHDAGVLSPVGTHTTTGRPLE
ncbi:uncharacterized protein MalAC0309_1357 [Microcella alkaliphila]|uniref:Uncharacterized protein n=1 Tax=Microcella alkaliphila TaxID=279828 RepID=A0A0U5BPM0_9MICO|nr:uncharacterized protein MalAC0309_1357 [Microcella alkaliphila]